MFISRNPRLPIIDVQVDFAAGAARDPAGKSGLAQLTRGLMDLGAGDMDESAIAERLADLGARLAVAPTPIAPASACARWPTPTSGAPPSTSCVG